MVRYNEIWNGVNPLLRELIDHERDYILMSSYLTATREYLAEQLRALKVETAADPRAAKDPVVMNILEDSEKYELLKSDRHTLYFATAKKVYGARAELVKLTKDVDAVIKAKSGIFSTSKSLPQLKTLSTTLHKFADDLQAAISADL